MVCCPAGALSRQRRIGLSTGAQTHDPGKARMVVLSGRTPPTDATDLCGIRESECQDGRVAGVIGASAEGESSL